MAGQAMDSLTVVPDSLASADSLFHMTVPVHTGTLDRWMDSARVIRRADVPWMPYRFLGDILATLPGTYLADQQSEGQYSRLWIQGADWRSIAVLQDGRPMNDPATGIFNLYWFQSEYADRIEVVSGPRAFLYGLNSTGAAVNLVTRNYSSNRPLSSLSYSEAGYNATRTDGFFSQNITRRMNISAGFQAQGTDGRFPNAYDEQWNSRAKLRFNPVSGLQLILAHGFLHTYADLNGGVDLAASGSVRSFDPLQATMRNTDAYEKVTRHDLDFTAIVSLLGDTVSLSTLSLYYSHQLREYRDEENRIGANGLFLQSDHTSSWTGLQVKQTLAGAWQRLQAGASIEQRQIEGSPNLGRRKNTIASAWGIEEIMPAEGMWFAGFARLDSYLHASYAGAGADGRVTPLPWLTLFGGLSSSRRVPTYQELSWTGDAVTRAADIHAERHFTAEGGVELRPDSGWTIRLGWFHRTVNEPLLIAGDNSRAFPSLFYYNGDRLLIDGVEAGVQARVWVLTLAGNGMWVVRKDETGSHLLSLPELSGSGGLYYWNTVLDGMLDLKVGARVRYAAGAAGELFNPEVIAYGRNDGYAPGRGSSVDALLFARIGSAHIHFLWTNLTSNRNFLTPYYPARDREIQFGITWQFLD